MYRNEIYEDTWNGETAEWVFKQPEVILCIDGMDKANRGCSL